MVGVNAEMKAGFVGWGTGALSPPYQEIHAVPPGKFVRIRDGEATIHSYWSFDTKRQIRYKTDVEYEEHFRHVFRQAVLRRLRSDSPILAEVSGGVDSSCEVCWRGDNNGEGVIHGARMQLSATPYNTVPRRE